MGEVAAGLHSLRNADSRERPAPLSEREVAYLIAAIRDIAEAEPIPTPPEAFAWCRDVARAALSRHQEQGHD